MSPFLSLCSDMLSYLTNWELTVSLALMLKSCGEEQEMVTTRTQALT